MIFARAVELFENGEQCCLAVIVAKSGSAPQVPGAKSIFLRDGRILGTIGGGCLEMEARRLALEALQKGLPLLREFKLDDDFGWDDGLICGGRVQVLLLPDASKYVDSFRSAVETNAKGALIYDLKGGGVEFAIDGGLVEKSLTTRREIMTDDFFVEPISTPENLYIFGAGHVGQEIGRVAGTLGFDVILIDDRAEFLTEERTPWATNRICESPHMAAARMDFGSEDYVCLVTRGHRNDAKVLREIIRKPAAFIGMIGSRRKREVVKSEMLAEGICSEEEFDRVRSPMGLDIGAESVAEIAVSVAAELVRVRAEKRGPILARCAQKPL